MVAPPEALVPAALGAPAAAYVSEEPYGLPPDARLRARRGRAPLAVHRRGDPRLRVRRRGPDPGFINKLVDGGTHVEEIEVGPYPALWLEGGPHTVLFKGAEGLVYEDQGRLAGNTLLVDRGDVLVRIEGEIGRERAVEIARSLG